MKKFNSLRKRGFTLIEITLVLIVGLGLIVGGLVYFQQAQAGSEVTDKTRALVSISSEVRAQYRMSPDFDGINVASDGGVAEGATTGAAIAASNFGVRTGLPASTFNDLTGIEGDGQDFTITMNNLSESVCKRLEVADLGPKSDATCTTSEDGNTLAVTYTR